MPQPTSKAVPLAVWEERQAEKKRQEEERRKAEAEVQAQRDREAAERRAAEESVNGPPMSAGLKQQLAVIRSSLSKTSDDRIAQLEAKVTALEGKLAEANKPLSAGGKAPPRGPPKK